MPLVCYCPFVQLGFSKVQGETSFGETFEKASESWQVLLSSTRHYDQVVKICCCTWRSSDDLIYQSLEGSCCVATEDRVGGKALWGDKRWNRLCPFNKGPVLSIRGICQYPLLRSKVVIIFALPTLSINSSTSGRGKESMTVTLLTFLKLVQKR